MQWRTNERQVMNDRSIFEEQSVGIEREISKANKRRFFFFFYFRCSTRKRRESERGRWKGKEKEKFNEGHFCPFTPKLS